MITCDACGHVNPDEADYCETESCRAYLPHQRPQPAHRRELEVEFATDAVSVRAGEVGHLQLTVRNHGAVTESVILEGTGEAQAARAEPGRIDLEPGGVAASTLVVPARALGPGRHAVTARARSGDDRTSSEDSTIVVVTVPPADSLASEAPTRQLPTVDPSETAPGTRGPVLALSVVLVLAFAALAYLLLRPDDSEPVRIRRIDVFDPGARGATSTSSDGENEAHFPRLTDGAGGDDAPSWRTEWFRERDGGFARKGGVGLLLHTARGAEVERVLVRSPTQDWAGAIYVRAAGPHAEPEPPFAVPIDLSAWGFVPVTDPVTGIEGDHEFRWEAHPDREVLLWVSDLGERNSCDEALTKVLSRIGCPDTRHFVVISELEVRGQDA